MSDRPTPETDALADSRIGMWSFNLPADFARNLERQRDEARELARELRDALAQCRDDSVELKLEWGWKRKNAGQRNEREYFEVECHVEMADAVLAKAKEVLHD